MYVQAFICTDVHTIQKYRIKKWRSQETFPFVWPIQPTPRPPTGRCCFCCCCHCNSHRKQHCLLIAESDSKRVGWEEEEEERANTRIDCEAVENSRTTSLRQPVLLLPDERVENPCTPSTCSSSSRQQRECEASRHGAHNDNVASVRVQSNSSSANALPASTLQLALQANFFYNCVCVCKV